MANLPTVPSFIAGESNVANLQSLSDAVAFIVDIDLRPEWHLYLTSTRAVAASTITTETFTQIAYDNDGVSDGTGVTIVTQGYYAVEACVGFIVPSTSPCRAMAWFQFTAGASNPNFVAGTTGIFGGEGLLSGSTANEDLTLSPSDVCPYLLYPGDQLRVQYQTDTAMTRSYNNNATYISGRFVPNFTGMLIRPA